MAPLLRDRDARFAVPTPVSLGPSVADVAPSAAVQFVVTRFSVELVGALLTSNGVVAVAATDHIISTVG